MKAHSMVISTKPKHKVLRDKSESSELKIPDNEIEVVQKTKYLDVKVDNLWVGKITLRQFRPRLKSDWIFKVCITLSVGRNFHELVHWYSGAALSILLFSLGFLLA